MLLFWKWMCQFLWLPFDVSLTLWYLEEEEMVVSKDNILNIGVSVHYVPQWSSLFHTFTSRLTLETLELGFFVFGINDWSHNG